MYRNWPSRVWFGLHYDLHAVKADTELGQNVTPAMLRRAWTKIRPDVVQCDCKGHPGWTSWPAKIGSPSPGIVRDALRIHRDVTRELGIPLVMHYSGVWDSRAIELHPGWAVIGPDHQPNKNATCPLSGYVDELMIPQLIELIDQYEVDGFWVDGDCWAAHPCYCRRCEKRFVKEHGFTRAPRSKDEPGWAEWLSFCRRLFFERTKRCADAVHARNPNCKYCSNWAFTFQMPDPINLPMDFLSGDFAFRCSIESVAINTRFIAGRGMPWNLMGWSFLTTEETMGGWTTKSRPGLCQEAAAVMAQGGGFLLYENLPRSGRLVEWRHHRFAQVARFCRQRQLHCQGTKTIPQVAILHGAGSFYADNKNLFGLDVGSNGIRGALLALIETHHSADILNEEALLPRIQDYAVVFLVNQTALSREFRAALKDYARKGGCLVLEGSHLGKDESELSGVTPASTAEVAKWSGRGQKYVWLPIDGEAAPVRAPWRLVRCNQAQPLLPLLSGPDPRHDASPFPAATLRSFGQGRVLSIHVPLLAYFQETHYPRLRDVFRRLMTKLRAPLLVKLDAPPRLEVVLRQKGRQLLVNLLNRGADHPLSPSNFMVEDVPAIPDVRLRVTLSNRPQSVSLQPGNRRVKWFWKSGKLHVGPFRVEIHDLVKIVRGDPMLH